MDREGSAITNAVGSTGAAEFSGNPNQSIVSGGRGTGRRGQIYIAYQKNDEEFVKDLHAYLKREGFTLFLDLVDLNTKQDHPPQFDKQLATSRCILIVWGENAYQSEWLRYEASVGRYRSIDLILRLGDAKIPDPWRLRARLDFSENGGAIQQGRITPSGKRKLIDEICSRIPDERLSQRINDAFFWCLRHISWIFGYVMTLLAIAVLIEVRNQVQSQFSAVTEIRREVLKIDSNALKLEMSKTYRLGKEGSRFFADYKKRLRTAVEKVIADNAGKRRVIENGSAVVLLEDSGKHIACIQPGSNLWPDPADLQEKIAAEALCFTMPSVHLVASPREELSSAGSAGPLVLMTHARLDGRPSADGSRGQDAMLYYEYNKDDADDTIKLAVKDLSALRFIETNAFVLREHYIGASISADLYDPTEEERPAPTSMSITIRFSEGGYVVTGNGQFKGSGGDMTYNGKLTSPQ